MPTARELLEQADALMRRNRLASAPAPEDGIPTLTDAVPPEQAAPPAPAPARAARGAEPPGDLEDVPLLTDAVEEIEAPSILEEPSLLDDVPEPDAAMWTDTLTGAHTIIPAVPIELPPATEAVGVLPEEWGASAPAGPALAVETIDIAPAPAEPADAAEPRSPLSTEGDGPRPVAPDAAAPPPPFESFPAHVDPTEPPAPAHDLPPPPPAEPLPFPEDTTPAGMDETQPATPFEWPGEGHAHGVAAEPAPIAPETAPAASAEEEERWTALAEEVRMQVLQRIDLFTDTGLREQLAARLQPIVDRASADLVATINQHVGVLLRAYVAEAIEREIERWRADRR